MREITIKDKTFIVAAAAITYKIYRDQFKSDLQSDFFRIYAGVNETISSMVGVDVSKLSEEEAKKLDTSKANLSSLASFNIDTLGILQIVWAMAKTANMGKPFPDYDAWYDSLGEFNPMDMSYIAPALEEAGKGLFCHNNSITPKK